MQFNGIPAHFTDSLGNVWHYSSGPKKPYRVYPPSLDARAMDASSSDWKAASSEEARQAWHEAQTYPVSNPVLTVPNWLRDGIESEASQATQLSSNTKKDSQPRRPGGFLASLLDREQSLSDAATKEVVFSPPLVSRNEAGILGRNTINIIQGAFGSHKSRLAELFASLMLANDPTAPCFLGYQRATLERFCVCYIDTERNQTEQLPHAIQGMKTRAGYELTDRPADFRFTTIKAVDRRDRFNAIEEFITHVRSTTNLHLFCLIDVVTDAVSDFNDAQESMKLYDFVGNLCDEHNATFLLVIHQNPGTEKARGHTGTEGGNKASTLLQIGYERDGNGNETDLIRLRYLKVRQGKRPEPLFLQYSDLAKGLILADAATLSANAQSRKQKADIIDIADRLSSLLSEGPLAKNEVWTVLGKEFEASNATIRERLKTLLNDQPAMYNSEGRAVRLTEYVEGRNQYFKLSVIE